MKKAKAGTHELMAANARKALAKLSLDELKTLERIAKTLASSGGDKDEWVGIPSTEAAIKRRISRAATHLAGELSELRRQLRAATKRGGLK